MTYFRKHVKSSHQKRVSSDQKIYFISICHLLENICYEAFSFLPGFKFSVMMAGLGTVTGGLLSSAASDWSSGVWSGLSLADISRLVSSVYRTSHDTRMV